MKWAEKHGVTIQHIQPGQPQQNAYIERYNRTVRHEWLDQYIIESIEEAQDHATQWLWTYNNDRPNVSVRSDRPACVIEWVIVSTIDSGHLEVSYGGEEGSEEAGLV